jgi:uncharacterized protein (TIGR02145 family)
MTSLTTCLGGELIAGGLMKEIGTTHWASPNTGATNSAGFIGLPGGSRSFFGVFADVTLGGNWWTSTQANATEGWLRKLSYNNANLTRLGATKTLGLSVRCIKN